MKSTLFSGTFSDSSGCFERCFRLVKRVKIETGAGSQLTAMISDGPSGAFDKWMRSYLRRWELIQVSRSERSPKSPKSKRKSKSVGFHLP